MMGILVVNMFHLELHFRGNKNSITKGELYSEQSQASKVKKQLMAKICELFSRNAPS